MCHLSIEDALNWNWDTFKFLHEWNTLGNIEKSLSVFCELQIIGSVESLNESSWETKDGRLTLLPWSHVEDLNLVMIIYVMEREDEGVFVESLDLEASCWNGARGIDHFKDF